ncbi:MAG: CRTAC1 family protein, partial [Myxococcota bacterium]
MRVLPSWRFALSLLCSLLLGCSTAPEPTSDDAGEARIEDTGPSGSDGDVGPRTPAPVEARLPEDLAGGFVDLTASVRPWPPFPVDPGEVMSERLPDVTFGVFADLNGGKSLEVILSGSLEAEVSRQTYTYDSDAGALIPWEADALPPGVVMGALDLDGDGHVDAIMAEDGGMIRVRWGDALGAFEAFTELTTVAPTFFSERTSVHLSDIDQDGWLDVMMNGACGMALLFRTGPRAWSDRPAALQGFDAHDPYALSTWPSQGRPPVLLALGHPGCGFYSAFQSDTRDDEGYPLFEPLSIYDSGQGGPSDDGVSAFMSPMGAAVADLDRDDALDLVMTLDPAHIILDGAVPWPVSSTQPDSGLLFSTTESGGFQVGWAVALVDLDKDGLDDVIVSHGDDAARFLGEQTSPGPQRATVHLNLGDFRFLDATAYLGLDRLGGWRAMTTGDLDGDADCDLIIGGLGEAPRVYRNDVMTPNRSLALRLEGRASNRFGVGAEVVVNPIGTSAQQRYVVGASGGPKSLSEPLIYAGLGTAAGADVTVYWPSGAVQVVAGLIAGNTHDITEPDVLSIAPTDRHLTAGSSEVAVLT